MKKKTCIIFTTFIFVCFAIFSLVSCSKYTQTEYDIVKKTKMENFELLNETANHGQVVFIGDSIIELFPTYEMFAEKDKVVYNRGISGDTSDRMLERLDKNALNINPEIVYILVGTNDIARGIEHSVTIENISKAVEQCKQNGVARIVVSGLYPVNKSINPSMVGRRSNKEIKEINEKIKSAVELKGAIFSDITNALADSNGNFNQELTYDGLHPNAKGFTVITNTIMPLIFGQK